MVVWCGVCVSIAAADRLDVRIMLVGPEVMQRWEGQVWTGCCLCCGRDDRWDRLGLLCGDGNPNQHREGLGRGRKA